MPLLKAEADKLSQSDMVRGIIEEFIDQEELFALLPFVGTSGNLTTITEKRLWRPVTG
ncbi:hypothetical protein JCM19235_1253 [Vibrio maritimus]|uniref:Uncharacterized protein n=1 Tax=Vibrio maritimus TaxID=990268 RepID=A0A090SUE9_9VIBR|nr:hypothetical protein JCM19235_1253 [Vibrio maritimus]